MVKPHKERDVQSRISMNIFWSLSTCDSTWEKQIKFLSYGYSDIEKHPEII
jgi:hypothetical protein